MTDVVLELPASLRSELKEPLGPLYTETGPLVADAAEPVVAVGDVVTYHLLGAEYTPAVAVVDERTKREAVDPEISEVISGRRSEPTTASGDDQGESSGAFSRELTVTNPAGTITGDLLDALVSGLATDETTLVRVDGEEDLAALAAVLAVPEGASVVYGQPDEGMVHVKVADDHRTEMRALLERFEGDTERFWDLLEGSSGGE